MLLDLDYILNGEQASAEDARTLVDNGAVVLIVSALGVPAQIRAMVRAGVAGFGAKTRLSGLTLGSHRCGIGRWHMDTVGTGSDPGQRRR